MEATGSHSSTLAKMASSTGLFGEARIVNPRLIHHYAKSLGLKNKTDRLDASAIARYGCERRPEPPAKRTAAEDELKAIVRARADFVKARTALAEQRRDIQPESLQEAYRDVEASLLRKIEELEEMMERVVAEDAAMKHDAELLDSIPGVGRVCVMTMLGELGDMRRFASRGKLVAFAGLNPVVKESGSSLRRRGGISKAGPSELRRVMHLAARAAACSSKDNPFRSFYEKKLKEGKSKLCAMTAVMRKMLVVARAVIVSDERFSAVHT